MAILEKYILPALVVVYTFIAPTFYWLGVIGFFICADLALRLLICLKKGDQIESRKLWKTVYKFGVAMVFILVAFACQKLFMPDIAFMKIIGAYLILVELKSIDEKALEITGYSLFNIIIEKLTPKK